MMKNDTTYILGHSDAELRRLELQANALEPLTTRLLREAGLTSGMTVLDIGTGAGDVAMLAAEIVGREGHVLGIDRNCAALERARTRAREKQLDWLSLDEVDFDSETKIGSFDLVIGRYVLIHQSDPASFVRIAASHVERNGVLAFIEMAQSASHCYSEPAVPSYNQVLDELIVAFRAARADLDVGSRLVSIFAEAGLPEPSLIADTPVGGPSSILAEWIARTLQSIRPSTEGPSSSWQGLADRIRSEAASAHSQLFAPRNVAAWTRLNPA